MEQENKHIDSFLSNVVKEAGTESPSDGFVMDVMDAIETEELAAPAFVYKPVFSTKHWLFVAACVVGIFVLAILLPENSVLSDKFANDVSKVEGFFSIFDGISINSIYTYALVFVAMMVIIQIPILKYQFSKNLSY